MATRKKYKRQRYIISTIQAAASPHYKFIEGLEQYSHDNNAHIIFLPTIGNCAAEDMNQIHPFFYDYDLEFGLRKLNNNIQIEQMNIRPYMIEPLTGLNRFAQQGTSLIIASPKQHLRAIAHSNRKLPKFLMTTGAATHPNYATGDDASAERRRLGNIAKRDHIYGALVVEIYDDEKYHVRNIRANSRGHFVDLGERYNGSEKLEAKLEAMVLGDFHNAQCDPNKRRVTMQMIEELCPRRIILHDYFDGISVSHHVEKQPIQQKLIQVLDKGLDSLEKELLDAYNTLIELSERSHGAKIFVVHSNHLDFLHRYLEEGRFMKDLSNFRIAVKLLDYMSAADYNNPVEAGIRMQGHLPSNIKFLRRDDDLKVRGYQLAVHGDLGPNGGRGNMKSKEEDHGKSITGHVHSAAIMRNTYTVGTLLPNNQFYMRGQPSKWTTTHGLLWDTGTVQLVSIVDNWYRLSD